MQARELEDGQQLSRRNKNCKNSNGFPTETCSLNGADLKQRLVQLDATFGCSSSRVGQSAQVVIIGAGLAGLAAAQQLHRSGSTNGAVVLLEAQSRLGGRVHTIGHSSYLLELGAQWLHGARDNPLYEELAALDMLDDFEDASLAFQGQFCTPVGSELEAGLVSRVLDIVNQSKLSLSKDATYLAGFNNAAENGAKRTNLSASQVFASQLEREMERDGLLKVADKQTIRAIFQWFLRYETIENGCDSMDEVSVQSYTDWTDWGDGTLLNFRLGYSSLLAWMCSQFPARDWIHLGKEVVNVDYNGGKSSDKVVVTYKESNLNDGGGANGQRERTIECDHVIVTVPLGFLKQNLATFFTPPLPKVRRQLIASLGFGTVNKIILQFERPFWPRSASGLKLVWQLDEGEPEEDQMPPWARDIVSFDVVRRQPRLLIGWIGGRGAKLMERETDETIGRVCLQLLERFLPQGHAKPTRLIACLCSRWNSNQFTRGSYSFQSIHSRDLPLEELQKPICAERDGEGEGEETPRVLFAGEATAGKLYSTTHGAIISGRREASRLAAHLKSSQKVGGRDSDQKSKCSGF